jgi:hypothetical protein
MDTRFGKPGYEARSLPNSSVGGYCFRAAFLLYSLEDLYFQLALAFTGAMRDIAIVSLPPSAE